MWFEFLDKWRKSLPSYEADINKTYDEPKEKGCNEHMIWRKKKFNQRSSSLQPKDGHYPRGGWGEWGNTIEGVLN